MNQKVSSLRVSIPKGYVIWRGPSLLDGEPIIAVALTGSANRKTGDMAQTYILRSDVAPHVALQDGRDASICGDCKHRPVLGGGCYVVVHQGPLQVFKSFRKGSYPDAHPATVSALIAGRTVRLGAYGDPAAVPVTVWSALLTHAAGHTGYTHQWNTEAGQQLREICMASCDTTEEREHAAAMDWRSYRIRLEHEPVLKREFVCPASDEAGKRLTCAQCHACDGAARGASKGSPTIVVHGSRSVRYREVRAQLVD